MGLGRRKGGGAGMQDYEKPRNREIKVGQVSLAAEREGEPFGHSHFWQGCG